MYDEQETAKFSFARNFYQDNGVLWETFERKIIPPQIKLISREKSCRSEASQRTVLQVGVIWNRDKGKLSELLEIMMEHGPLMGIINHSASISFK